MNFAYDSFVLVRVLDITQTLHKWSVRMRRCKTSQKRIDATRQGGLGEVWQRNDFMYMGGGGYYRLKVAFYRVYIIHF